MTALDRRSHRGLTLVVAVMLALVLVLTLLVARTPTPAVAGSAKTQVQIVRELRGMVKRIEGLERFRVNKKDPTKTAGRIKAGTADLEKTKWAFIRLHLRDEKVHGRFFIPVFGGFESLDQRLADARDASRVKPGSREKLKNLEGPVNFALEIADSSIGGLFRDFDPSVFPESTLPDAARADLEVMRQDLKSVAKGFKRGRIRDEKFRRRIGGIVKAKHELIARHFASELVCGVSFDLVFRQLECADERLGLARRAAKGKDFNNARRHLRRAASCLRALQANFLAVTPPG